MACFDLLLINLPRVLEISKISRFPTARGGAVDPQKSFARFRLFIRNSNRRRRFCSIIQCDQFVPPITDVTGPILKDDDVVMKQPVKHFTQNFTFCMSVRIANLKTTTALHFHSQPQLSTQTATVPFTFLHPVRQ